MTSQWWWALPNWPERSPHCTPPPRVLPVEAGAGRKIPALGAGFQHGDHLVTSMWREVLPAGFSVQELAVEVRWWVVVAL